MTNKKPQTELRKLDLDFYENVILFNALTNQEYLAAIVEYTEPVYFKDEKVKSVFQKIVEFFNERGCCPSLSEIKARLISDTDKNSFKEIVNRFKQLDTNFNKDELLCNTERFLKERCLYKIIAETAEKHSKGEADIGEALHSFEKAYAINLNEDMGHFYFEEIDEHIKDLTTVYNPVPTGWKFLDDRIEGGLFPKTLTCILGQVNVGKSIFLGNIATNMVLRHKNTLLISLEMSEFMYSKRVSAQLTQIPHSDLKIYANELRENVLQIGQGLDSKLVVKEYPPKSVTVRQIDAYITKLSHKGFKPDVIVIDYVNLIKPMTKGLNTYEGIKEIAEMLRAMAFKYNIPIVTASQLKRDAFNTSNPGMEGVSESIALAATCDIMCSIWQEAEDKELGIINMGIIKNRFGPNFGSAAFKIKYETLTLSETDKDHFAEDSPQTVISSIDSTLSKLGG